MGVREKITEYNPQKYDLDKLYNFLLGRIDLGDYPFLKDKKFIFPFIKDPTINILNDLGKIDDFFMSLAEFLLLKNEDAHKYFNGFPKKDNDIYAIINDYICLNGKNSAYVGDCNDYRSQAFLKFQYENLIKFKQYSSFTLKGNELIGAQGEIESFFSICGLEYDTGIFTLKNLQTIYDFSVREQLSVVEFDFISNVYGYIIAGIIASNLSETVSAINSFEDIVRGCENNETLFYGGFLNHILSSMLLIKQNKESAFEVFDRKKLRNDFHGVYNLGEIERFQKSYLYKEYYVNQKVSNIFLLRILLGNPDLFIAFKNIPYGKIFNFLLENEDDTFYIKVGLFLQDRKGLKMKESTLLFLLENILHTHQIIQVENLGLYLKYFDFGVDNKEVLSLSLDTLRKIDNYPGDKKVLLKGLLKNPNYLEELEKEKYIQEIISDIVFISDSEPQKDEIYEIFEKKGELTLDEIKISVLKIIISNGFDIQILYHKKIFRNDKQNISLKLILLAQLEKSSVGVLQKKDEIFSQIFCYDLEKVEKICFIFSRLVIPQNITVKSFFELVELVFSKMKYVSSFLKGKESMTIQEFHELLDNKKMKNDLKYALQSVFSPDMFSYLEHMLSLNQNNIKTEKGYLILEVAKKLTPDMYEDFILACDGLSTKEIQNISHLTSFFKYLRLPFVFDELLLKTVSEEKIATLKKTLSHAVLVKVKNTNELKQKVYDYFSIGDITSMQKYVANIEKETELLTFDNSIDSHLYNIYKSGESLDIDEIVRIIDNFVTEIVDLMHPSHTTSTCNANFGKGSGSYSEVILNHIIKKLLKKDEEENDEYLSRILSLRFLGLLNIENLSDFHGNHELRCLYLASLKYDDSYGVISFLQNLGKLMGEITGELYINLSDLQKYYQVGLEKSLRKLKRSLGI